MKAVERKLQIPKIQVPELATPEVKTFATQIISAHRALIEQYNRQDDSFQMALRGGVNAENSSAVKHVSLKIQMPSDAPWVDFTLLGTFAPGGAGAYTPGFLMEPGGHVSLRGQATGSAPDYAAASGKVATLNTGYIPGKEIAFASEGGANVVGIIRIQVDGTVRFAASVSGAPYIFLEPCTWIAPNAAVPHGFTIASPTQWPIIIEHPFKKCLGFEVVSCRDANSPSGSAGAPVPDWEDIGKGQLRLNGLWGLQWGKRYDVRVRMTAEE